MKINNVDWMIIIFIMTITVIVGIYSSKKASKDTNQFFLSGKKMPWWLLGISMVATTFSTDTPNLVTDIVRNNGVSGNWVWWAFMITGFLTVFVYARLWRRTGINSDNEFYDIRYSGKAAKFLKSFRAVYLGLIFNVLAMSGISLAAIKIGEIIFNLQPVETIFYAGVITVLFSTLGGFRGVVLTDFFLLTQCRYFIVGPSTFHWWGAWLSNFDDKICVRTNNLNPSNNKDFWPEKWTII